MATAKQSAAARKNVKKAASAALRKKTIAHDKYVLVEREKLKKLQPHSPSVMGILQIAKRDDVDPIYFETSCFCVPEEAGKKAYEILFRRIESLPYAIAKLTVHQCEQTIILRPYAGGLTLHTLYYPADIREAKGYGQDSGKDLKKEEIRLGKQFAKNLLKPFHPQEFHDEYQDKVQELVESKGEEAGTRKTACTRGRPDVRFEKERRRSAVGRNQGGKLKRTA